MQILPVSDIHMEFGKVRLPNLTKDLVVVMAGDLHVGCGLINYLDRSVLPYVKAVVLTFGNHEFYGQVMPEVRQRWKDFMLDRPNLYVLDNDHYVIDDVTFIGGTLWTDMNNNCPAVKAYCKLRMNDYKIIRKLPKTFGKDRFVSPDYSRSDVADKYFLTPDDTVLEHYATMQYLKKNIDPAKKTVVVTHHAPTHMALNTQRYNPSDLDYAYYTDLTGFMYDKQPDLWVFGHTHKTLDVNIHNTRVVSNPRGYVGHDVNPYFNPNMRIKL